MYHSIIAFAQKALRPGFNNPLHTCRSTIDALNQIHFVPNSRFCFYLLLVFLGMRSSQPILLRPIFCLWRLLPVLLLPMLALPPAFSAPAACTITVETSDIVADSEGLLCFIDQLNSGNCCPKQEGGMPEGLLPSLCKGSCCRHYAACVHRCMGDAPARQEVIDVAHQSRFRDAVSQAKDAAPFALCRDVCRTHSGSVINGNSFISDFRFCYGSYIGKPPPPLPPGIAILAADQGESCEDVCARNKRRCSVDALPSVNTCTLLSKHFKCQSGCANNVGGDQPAYVVLSTDAHYGKCLTNNDPALFSCSGRHANTRRLCPCA